MLSQLDTEDYRGDEEEETIANGEPESILRMKKGFTLTSCNLLNFHLRNLENDSLNIK